ncbi:actin-related protein ARP5 NDAI_0D01060 [Naumovozyma dairenensis CBS 421]|uniref:Actin-related protein 5 n=1 Tax=Naumovozyma dairenensis (strain ATCC 10597 / BCRC 20456 / CBS 421 / NBRC 0211 / NRRL Y-12639) TaxID=1071378 RepID=G0W9F8_NAUDC|nr:hypothetical protein NDAI_0D01060 [Naumovozyma dairenensis CBS 421]CCD24419.1 hypothetical protein NDAI_0D01060 [Naumovozyma dairenensis CBS 421]
MSRDDSLQPLKVTVIDDPPLTDQPEAFNDKSNYNPEIPIAIDFGSSTVRAGYTNEARPSHIFPTKLTRYRDRKINKTFTFTGNDCSLDQTIRSQMKSPFDGALITNWDYVEDILQYTFNHLGVVPDHGVQNPIIITEKLATIQSQRSNWYQLLFETYNVPKATFGIDSLFAFYNNNNGSATSTGMVIDCSHEETNIIPIVDGQGILTDAKRINWGGRHAIDYLSNLLALKYPYFPTKLSSYQYESMYQNFCYVSQDYDEEISKILTLDVLEEKDVVIETPFTEVLQPQKTEEELRIQAEKRKESGRRLQEQAKKRRIEKLIEKEEEYEYFSKIREDLKDQPKKKILSILQNSGFDDEDDFKRYLFNLERSLKRARANDEDAMLENIQDNETTDGKFDLLEIPDEKLDPEQIKEKRKQRLLKAGQDARKKAREEKQKAAEKAEELRLKEIEWRKIDLNGWIKDKRSKLNTLVKRRKDKIRMRDEMKDRKSQAAQNRMKNLATLAEDNLRTGTKRSRQQATIDNDPNDTFGTNDEDWFVYNDITKNPDAFEEALEEEYKEIIELEGLLLEHDPNFTEEDTVEAQYDWRNSTLHLFLRGPRPHDSEDIHQQHQIHLNVERIRVPEIVFQPSMGGLDQAGIAELSETILLRKFGSEPKHLSELSLTMANNIWLTGGNSKIPGLRERIVKEFREFLPVNTQFNVNMTSDPTFDAWNGMAKLAQNETDYKKTIISKKEYEEYGPEYIKEHKLGNMKYFE